MNDNDRRAAFLGAQVDPHIPVIDLHLADGLEVALSQLEYELDKVSRTDARYCRVIHGIGSGVLAETVHKFLTKNKQILGFEEESGGSCIVLF